MENALTTIVTVRSACKRVAISVGREPSAYQSTLKQVFFFSLIQLHKKKFVFHAYDDVLLGLSERDVVYWTQMIAKHLDECGVWVAALRDKDEKEWETMRFQIKTSLRKIARRYGCLDRDDLNGDAYGGSLCKITEVLTQLLTPHHIEAINDTLVLFLDLSEDERKVYYFASPFGAYANRIAENELVTALRKETSSQKRHVQLEEVEEFAQKDSKLRIKSPEDDLVESETFEEVHDHYREQLAKLLNLIQTTLPPKPCQVILYTLAARSQFRDLLDRLDLDFAPYQRFEGCASDTEIANALQINENNVRVQRNNGKKRIAELNLEMGNLLKNLLGRGK